MEDKSTPKDIENDDHSLINEIKDDNDYEQLFSRFKEIKKTIALLEKFYLDKL